MTRDDLVELVQNADIGVFTISQELPYTVDNQPLFIKNSKKIYIDLPAITITNAFPTLDNLSVRQETVRITLFMSNEARVLPGYNDVIANLQNLKDDTGVKQMGYTGRNCSVTTRYQDNLLVTQIDYEFSRLL